MDMRKGNEVSFLFGSAISLPDQGIGMPSVAEMVDLIRDHLSSLGDDGLDAYIEEYKDASAYQAAFKYLFAVGSQEDAKEILLKAVNRAKDENGKWVLPKTVKDFAKIISTNTLVVKNILTTNFDPFIEESLANSEYNINRIDLTEDLTFDNGFSHNNKRINVIHLHGYYEGDTMHTPDQLTSFRDESIACLKRILQDSKLYIIGYGGWDDIINQTLIEMISEKKSRYDIRWGYFSNDEKDIITRNDVFFKRISAAQSRARFNAYKNVNCANFFEDAHNKALSVVLDVRDKPAQQEEDNLKDKAIISLSEIYSPQKKSDPIELKEFSIDVDPAHRAIRISEQESAREFLKKDGSFTVISGWGYGKLAFAASLIHYQYPRAIIYRVDCSYVQSRSEIELQFRKDIGLDFTTLVASADKEKVTIILFDNITELNVNVSSYFNDVISIIKDRIGSLKAIFFTSAAFNINNNSITLKPLNLAEISEYVKESVNYTVTEDILETISRRSSGLPVKLDVMKEYFVASSVNHALTRPDEEFFTDDAINTDSIPSKILELIREFSNSENEENKRCYFLLQILCVVECGETAENITRSFHDKKFKLNDFIKLSKNGLTHPFKLTALQDTTVHKINTVIKDYVKSKINFDTLERIRKQTTKMVCGDIWYNRRVSVSRVTTALLDNINSQPGNAHILLTGLLHRPLANSDSGVYLDAALSYAYFLSRNSRYKETLAFINEVLPFYSQEKEISYFKLIDYMTESMRMLDKEAEVISILETELKSYNTDNKFYIKSVHESLVSTLLLSYTKADKDKAYSMAESLRKTAEKNTYKRFLCDTVLAGKYEKNEKSSKLKRIEKNARNHNLITLANNICLDLAVLDPDNSKNYITTVLKSEKSNYTNVRAILGKIEGLLSDSTSSTISSKDIISLTNCYTYLFIQRIDGMFNRCHDLLWSIFSSENKTDDLFDIYVSSSLVWRVSGRQDQEASCLKKMLGVLESNGENYPIYIGYLERRSEALLLN